MTNETPAGWYAAPSEPGFERYWNGSTWADDRRPLAPAAPPRPGYRPATGGEIAGLVVSILALVTSFFGPGLVLGIVASVILAISERRNPGRSGIARAGYILAIIACVLGLLVAIKAGFAAVNS